MKWLHRPRALTQAGVVRKVPVESVTLGLLTTGAPAGAPQADGDVKGAAVAVVWRDVGAWEKEIMSAKCQRGIYVYIYSFVCTYNWNF